MTTSPTPSGRPSRSTVAGGLLALGALCVSGGLVWLGLHAPLLGARSSSPGTAAGPAELPLMAVAVEGLKLAVAGLVGVVVSAVHRRYPGDKSLTRSLGQAQVLLCMAGALMMIIIGDSLARALGIAGGATIIRFRTPVEDPKDSTVLFLLLGLGVACGMGLYVVAGVATALLCLSLVLLDLIVERKPQAMILEMSSEGPGFPTEYVNRLLAAYRVRFEPREVGHGSKATSHYLCYLDPDTPLQRLTEQLLDTSAGGVKKVAWEVPKKI
jgi:hypothetical protein